MSDLQAYWLSSSGDMAPDPSPDSDSWCNYDAAQSELAALREELAEIKESLAYRGSLLNRTQQRAEAAEQRNATLTKLLGDLYETVDFVWPEVVDALAQPTESGASE